MGGNAPSGLPPTGGLHRRSSRCPTPRSTSRLRPARPRSSRRPLATTPQCAGVATIAATTKSVVVTPGIDLTSASAVVATLQGNPGGTTTVQRVSIDTVNDRFTIWLTANSTATVKVAWHVFG
jgi:hypothetical protein